MPPFIVHVPAGICDRFCLFLVYDLPLPICTSSHCYAAIVIVPAVIDTLHRAQRFELTYHLIIIIRRNHDHSEQAARNGRSPTPLLLRHRFIGFIGSTPHGPIGPIIVVVIAGITALSGNLDAASTPLRQHPKFLCII